MNNLLKKIIIINMLFIIFLYSNISLAASMSDLKDEKNEVTNSITKAKKKLDDISDEKSETLEQVSELITQISDFQTEIDDLNDKISELETKISDTEEQIAKDEAEYKKEDESLNERLVAMYQSGDTTYLDFLLSSASLVDFISSYYLVSEVTDYDTQMLEEIENHKQKIENEKAELENDKSELDKSKTTVQSKQQALEVAKKTKEEYAKQLSDNQKEIEESLEELRKHENSIQSKIDSLTAEYNAEKARNAASSAGATTYSDGGTSNYGFGYPVTSHNLTNTFGVRKPYYALGYHTGIDFPVAAGTSVYSIGDGQVVDANYHSGWGYNITVYHGNNIYSFYAHLSSLSVSSGTYVSKGQLIARSGNTGSFSQGAHLHFEIRSPGSRWSAANCKNPMNYLP